MTKKEYLEDPTGLDEYDLKIVQEYWDEVDETADSDDILDNLAWGSSDAQEFIDFQLEEMNLEIPNWIVIDYEKTWNGMRYDFDKTSNYIFYNHF